MDDCTADVSFREQFFTCSERPERHKGRSRFRQRKRRQGQQRQSRSTADCTMDFRPAARRQCTAVGCDLLLVNNFKARSDFPTGLFVETSVIQVECQLQDRYRLFVGARTSTLRHTASLLVEFCKRGKGCFDDPDQKCLVAECSTSTRIHL